MTQLYGLMEATSTVSIMTPAEHIETLNSPRFGSIGRGSPLVMLDVASESGLPLLQQRWTFAGYLLLAAGLCLL